MKARRHLLPIDVDGGQLSVCRTGSGRGGLLLLHGWMLDSRIWQPQHDGIRRQGQVLSFDRRGFGQATAPAALSREPGDILRILDRLDISRIWLVGQSQSARVALAFALAHPARTRGLILQSPPDCERSTGSLAEDVPLDRFRDLARAGKLPEVRRAWLAHPLMHSDNSAVTEWLVDTVSGYRGTDLVGNDPGINLASSELGGLRCPTLVIVGEREPSSRLTAASRLVACVPGAQLRVISGAGHLCNIERPDLFNPVVEGFIAGDPAARRAPAAT